MVKTGPIQPQLLDIICDIQSKVQPTSNMGFFQHLSPNDGGFAVNMAQTNTNLPNSRGESDYNMMLDHEKKLPQRAFDDFDHRELHQDTATSTPP